jgi:hypothetical protein
MYGSSKSPGRPRVSDDNIERVRAAFQRSPRRSVARASRELDMPKITVWKVLCKRLCFKPCKMRLVQALTPADKVKRRDFCEEMQLKMEESDFVERLIFCDEATFLNRARNSRCTVITDLDTSKRSIQNAFFCCDAILETGLAAPH